MRWLTYGGAGVVVATVGYVLIGWVMYDFDAPCYEAEPGDRIINEIEFEGTRMWTRVGTWRFTGYELRTLTYSPMDQMTSWVNSQFGLCFSPLVSVVRQCQGLAYRAEAHDDESDPGLRGCSRSHRWVILEP